MNIEKIKGLDKLSEQAKAMFISIYAKHRNGVEDKAAWTAIKVEEKKDHVKVCFKNGSWLHYRWEGWY